MTAEPRNDRAARPHRRGAALVLLALTACGDSRNADRFAVRDSAGVRIAESDAPAWTTERGWRIADAPHLDVGAVEGSPGHDLDGVVGAFRLADGRVVVGDGGSREIRIFDMGGTLLVASGRAGAGPGEFGSLSRVLPLAPDSILALDGRLRRLTVFTADGALARTAQLETGDASPTPFALLGRILLARAGFTFGNDTRPGLHRDTVTVVRFDLDGRLLDSIGRFARDDAFVYRDGTSTFAGNAMFGRTSHFATFGDGFYFGSGDSYAVEARRADGSLAGLVRAARPNQEVSARHVARMREPDPGMSAADNAFWHRILDATPVPSHFPAFAAIAAEPDGHLWVREYAFPPDSGAVVWQVFAPEGRWLGPVTLPPRFRILGISADEILGVWRDDVDVEHVRAYRLVREPR